MAVTLSVKLSAVSVAIFFVTLLLEPVDFILKFYLFTYLFVCCLINGFVSSDCRVGRLGKKKNREWCVRRLSLPNSYSENCLEVERMVTKIGCPLPQLLFERGTSQIRSAIHLTTTFSNTVSLLCLMNVRLELRA
jgi:hypothetical protein